MYARPVFNPLDMSKTNVVWRFYTEAAEWKWQTLSAAGEVISESAATYKSYDDCIRHAEESGYIFKPAEAKKSFDSSRHVN